MSTTKSKSKMKNTGRATSYSPISNNIYFDGTSYRVRVSVDGMKYSKNFTSKKQAIQYRNQLLNG